MSRTNKNNIGHRPIFIISSMLDHLSLRENMERHTELGDLLTDGRFSFKEVEGCYQGIRELSYLVGGSGLTGTKLLLLAHQFGQDSVFEVQEQNLARLLHTNGERELIPGEFQRITEEEARAAGNWTRDGNQYWGLK